MSLIVEAPEVNLKPIQTYWLENDAGQTPTSTSIHPDFLKLAHGSFLDVGCCSGRGSRELVQHGCNVVGVDLNFRELVYGKNLNSDIFNIPYVQSYGERLPFPSSIFDGGILLGLLGAVGKNTRDQIIAETVRCLKPNAYVYVAEFAQITDPETQTSDGKRWIDVYKTDFPVTGEYGSVRVLEDNGQTRFVGHHFQEDELSKLLECHGIKIARSEKVQVKSAVSGKARDNWNIWGVKI